MICGRRAMGEQQNQEENMDLSKVEHVKHVVAGGADMCDICRSTVLLHGFDDAVNHLLSVHGGTLLHLGTDSSPGERDQVMHKTSAVISLPQPKN